MEVAYAALANAVEEAGDGRIHVLGFDITRFVGRYPLTIPNLVLIIKLVFDREECGGQVHLSVHYTSPDGQRLDPHIEQDIQLPVLENPDHKAYLRILYGIQNLIFPTPGVYTFLLFKNDQELKRVRVLAEEIPGEPPANEAAAGPQA